MHWLVSRELADRGSGGQRVGSARNERALDPARSDGIQALIDYELPSSVGIQQLATLVATQLDLVN